MTATGLEPTTSWFINERSSQTDQIIEMCCEYLSVRCIWLHVLIMSRMRFRVYPHSIVTWISRNSLLEAGAKFDFWNLISDFASASSKEFLDIQITIECGFTLKRVRGMIRTYSYKWFFPTYNIKGIKFSKLFH